MRVAAVTARRLDAAVADTQRRGRLPSVTAAVARDGGLLWCGTAAGVSTDGDPGDRQYRIGSITKTMTAVLVLQLRDEGALSLSEPLSTYVPEVAYADRTLRSLLSHVAGLPSEPTGPWWERSPGVPFADLAAGLRGGASPHEPGATFHYSNVAFALLGEVATRLRGQPWSDCLRDRILRPLGMTRTTYLPEPPHAQGYSVHPYAGTLTAEPATDTGAMAPAGQLWSTVTDLAAYASFLAIGNEDVLAQESWREMARPQAVVDPESLSAYGLGLRLVRPSGRVLLGHTGTMPGFQASLFVDRERRAGAVVLANGTVGLETDTVAPRLLEILHDSEPALPEPWRPVREVPAQVRDVLGVWHWGNTPFVLTWDGDQVEMCALREPADRETFAPQEDGSFLGTGGYHQGELLRVARTAEGLVSHLEVATFVLTRTPYDPAAPIPGGPPTSGGDNGA